MRKTVRTDKAPAAIGPYSQAVRSGGFLFCSGQIPLDPESGKLVEGGIEAQTERVLMNLEAVLAAGGATLAAVVKTTVFLADLADFPAMNAVYGRYFPEDPPARATVQAARLPAGARVEIEAVARTKADDLTAFTTRPDLMHWVHTWRCRTVPFRIAFTRWILGFQTFLVLLLAWETLCPKLGPFPQIAHLAMVSSVKITFNNYHVS